MCKVSFPGIWVISCDSVMNQQAGFGERNYWSTKKKSIPGFELIDYET